MMTSRNKGTFILLAILVLTMITITDVDARIIHVTVTGDNNSGDGSIANPYGGVQRAIRDTSPGDTVYVHEGTYPNEPAAGGYPIYGDVGQYIYIMGVPGEDNPVFSSSETAGFVSTTGGDNPPHHFVLKRLTYKKSDPYSGSHCINIASSDQVYPAIHDVIIDSCEFYNRRQNSQMIKMAGVDNFVIKDCVMNASNGTVIGIAGVGCHNGELYNCKIDSCMQGGIEFKGGSSEIVIRNNYVNMTYFTGINLGGDTGVEYLRPVLSEMEQPPYEARGIEVYSNIIVDCAASIAFDTARNCKVYNNLIIRTELTRSPDGPYDNLGLVWVRHSSWSCSTPSNNNLFANNIVYFNEREPYWENVVWHNTVEDSGDLSSTHQFLNNVWYCFDNPATSFASWSDEGRVDEPIVSGNVFGENPLLQTDPGTGVPIATNSVLLGGKGVSLAPPDGFEFTDFLGEAYTYPLPIGPFNMYYEPGAPPSPTSIDRLVPENLSGKKE